MFTPVMHGIPDLFGALGVVVSGLFFSLCLAVAVGLIFLLVRFLLVATHAAQIYVAKNEPVEPEAPVVPATTSPARKPRTPKTPPA